MLYSERHLRAEADYRREALRRSAPPNAQEKFYLEQGRNRSRYRRGDKWPPMAGMRSTLGRVVHLAVPGGNRLKKVRHA
jgi:hypothetical protein